MPVSLSLRRALPTLGLLLLGAPALYSQHAWSTTQSQESIAMMAAIQHAAEALPNGILFRTELSESDQRRLLAAKANAVSVTRKAFDHHAALCADVLEGNYLSADMADELGRQMSLIDTYYADAAVPYFKRVVASLSPEGAQALLLLKTRLMALSRARSVDWESYADAMPAELVNTVYSSCRP